MPSLDADRRYQAFLVLFPAGVGCLLGALVLDYDFAVRGFDVAALSAALVFALAAAVSPVSGIRRPARSYRFLSGVGRSPLSRQALLVMLFDVLLLVHWALVLSGSAPSALGLVTAVTGGAAIAAVSVTHWLPSRPGWRHWSTPAFLFGGVFAVGVAAALVIALAWPDSLPADSGAVRAGRALVIAGAGLIGVAIVGRSLHLSRGGARTREVWALTQGAYRGEHLTAGSLVVVTLVAAAFAYAWPWAIVVAFLAALSGQALLWRLFIVTGVALSWRAEVRWSLPLEPVGKEG